VILHLLFFLSGAAGLVYQVVWVREFGNVFGNTVHSASLVVAVFLLGLGVGSWAAGIWADRRWAWKPGSMVRAYGWVELAVAVLGLSVSLVLPRLGEISARISSYVRDPNGWTVLSAGSYLARYAIAVAMIAPVTLLMGATLTLLIRHRVGRDLGLAGWRIGALYGVNTAGAAAGCFLTDQSFIPSFGLAGTQYVAVFLNLVAGLGALRLASRDACVPTPSEVATPAAAGRRGVRAVGLALFVSGFVALAMEIVWFRHVSSLLGSYRAVFSLILAVVLLGIWLGSIAGGWVHRRFGRPAFFFMLVQGLFVVSALVGLAAASLERVLEEQKEAAPAFLAASGGGREALVLWLNLRAILREIGIPALLMGFAYPLANGVVQDTIGNVGRRAGLLYLANTAGAVLGSLAAGFLLLPQLGMQRTATLLAVLAALGLLPLFLASRRASTAGFATSLALVAGGLVFWLRFPRDHLVERVLPPARPQERLLAVGEGLTEVIAVTEMPGDVRTLVTNGHYMSGTSWLSQRYMRAMAHVPLLSMDSPERALVIGFGAGITAHAATLHPSIRRVDVVDTSRQILLHAPYFAGANGNVLADPRVAVTVDDGRHHLRMSSPETYDLITLEPPPLSFAGVSSLYSREFYLLARSRLAKGGYLTQWLPAYQTLPHVTLSLVRAFLDAFPEAVLLSGTMSELILMGVKDGPMEIDPDRVRTRLAAAPKVQADLEKVSLGTLTEIVGTFAGSARTLAAATRSARPVTDDEPNPEYAVASRLSVHEIPREIFDLGDVRSWCPWCFVDGEPAPGLEHLASYLGILSRLREDPAFRRYEWPYASSDRVGEVPVTLDPATLERVASSRYLEAVFREALGARR
jgi:predicted membrane-bound spermidine synthase